MFVELSFIIIIISVSFHPFLRFICKEFYPVCLPVVQINFLQIVVISNLFTFSLGITL